MVPEALDELEAKLEPAARFVVATLRDENAQQRKQLEANVEQLRILADQIVILTEQVADLNRRLFGRRAEKNPTVREDIRRAIDPNELTVDGKPMPAEPEARAKEKRRKARRDSESARRSRRLGKKSLPVIVETREVEANQLPEGYTLEDFRELGDGKVVERYEHVHEHLVIQRYILQALVSKDGEHIITAVSPPGVVDGGLYGPGLHAHVAVSRCDDSMPLCRTEKTLSRAGAPIARSTLCSLFHRTAEQLRPLYEEMKRAVRCSQYVHADETGQPVLDKDKCHRGWMWLILSQQAIVYHYSEGRGSDTAKALLGETAGNVTVDGYSGYNCLTTGTVNRVRSGCWGHLRRKVFEAMTVDVKNHENREVLDLIAELYKVEDEALNRGIEGSDEHLALRQTRSRKIVTSIWQWFDARNGKHSPKSKMGGAITYAIKQRETLVRFLDDPHLQLDNNIAERALRIVALGRKNSLFAGSTDHAQNLAMLHTIIATCRLHEVNPYDYIRDMLIVIQDYPAARIVELMPWRWRPPSTH
jgi:transposase